MSASANIARHLPLMAARQPGRPAVKIPRGRTGSGDIVYLTLSFAELDAEVDAWVARLSANGVRRGDRVLVMVRQGLPLIAAAFALFKHGAVPVVIDPGMGLKSFLACVARTRPSALLGIPFAQLISRVCWQPFASVRNRLWVSGSTTARLLQPGSIVNRKSEIVNPSSAELAAVLFTSGSTGAPKGVCYDHGILDAQVRLVRDTYGIEPGEVDLPMLPIFALFNPALGMTTVVPELDPSRPATVDPEKIARAIQQEKVTNSFGSPTLWRKIARHCAARGLTLPSLRRVLMAGAPVPPALFAAVQKILPAGTAHSPYGATESLPVCTISAQEVLGRQGAKLQTPTSNIQTKAGSEFLGAWSLELGTSAATAAGKGTCVGRPVAEMTVKIIAITDDPIPTLTDARELPAGEIGEIIVRGPVVTREYDQLPEATALAKIENQKSKIENGASTTWHRLGDLGYLDTLGRLWFCGRKAERVETADGPLYTGQVEPVFNAHPGVRRTALVGLGERGKQRAALVVEPLSREVVATPSLRRKLVRELRALGAAHPHTDRVRLVFLHPSLPVDVRHNAKIHRLTLAHWANRHHGYEMDRRDVPREALGQ